MGTEIAKTGIIGNDEVPKNQPTPENSLEELYVRVLASGTKVLERVTDTTPADVIIEKLDIEKDQYDSAIFIMGGAGKFDKDRVHKLETAIFTALFTMAQAFGGRLLIGDGGTQSGVMKIAGKARLEAQKEGFAPLLVGVTPEQQAVYDEDESPPSWEYTAPLDLNHSHIVVVTVDDTRPEFIGKNNFWGGETETMYRVFGELSKDVSNIGIVANGGDITIDEVAENLKQGRKLIVIKGSERAADGLAAWLEDRESADPYEQSVVGKLKKRLGVDSIEKYREQFVIVDLNGEDPTAQLIAELSKALNTTDTETGVGFGTAPETATEINQAASA